MQTDGNTNGSSAQIINGKAVAAAIRAELKAEILKLKQGGEFHVGLGAIIVGDNPASQLYVGMKHKACEEVGIYSPVVELKADAEELRKTLDEMNRNPDIDGILLQLPLPKGMDADTFVKMIDPMKDADGLHPYNMGLLMRGESIVDSCTPAGVMKLLESIHFDCAGKEAVVVGRSNIVGKPMLQLLLGKNATVTLCHSKTRDLAAHVGRADLVIAAAGQPELVKGAWIKPGAVVIDVGTNKLPSGKLVGDVEFAEAAKRASYITPVPGGVGPMTVAMLLYNTVQLAKARRGRS